MRTKFHLCCDTQLVCESAVSALLVVLSRKSIVGDVEAMAMMRNLSK
jgi:hypothetical protein